MRPAAPIRNWGALRLTWHDGGISRQWIRCVDDFCDAAARLLGRSSNVVCAGRPYQRRAPAAGPDTMRAGTFSMAATNHQLRDHAELDERHRRDREGRRRREREESRRSMQSMNTAGSSVASGEFDLDVVLEGSDSDTSSYARERRGSTGSSFSELDGFDAEAGAGALGRSMPSSGATGFGAFVPRASPTGSLGTAGSAASGGMRSTALTAEELEAFRVRRDKQKRREMEMEQHNRRRARRVFGVAPPKRKKRRRKRVVHVTYEEFYDAYELSDGQKRAK